MNGQDYTGGFDLQFSENLKFDRIAPMAGPVDKVTNVQIWGQGMKTSNPSNNYNYKWGTLLTSKIDAVSVKDYTFYLQKWLSTESVNSGL